MGWSRRFQRRPTTLTPAMALSCPSRRPFSSTGMERLAGLPSTMSAPLSSALKLIPNIRSLKELVSTTTGRGVSDMIRRMAS